MHCTVISKFLEAVSTLIDSEKTPTDYGTGQMLFHSEIHFMEAIFKYPEKNAAELSKTLKITRGAVTQIANKMEEKGYIARFLKQGNKKEKYFKLTVAGKELRKAHTKYHQEANQMICNYVKTLSDAENKVIMDFLNQLTSLPICEFECSEICRFSYKMDAFNKEES